MKIVLFSLLVFSVLNVGSAFADMTITPTIGSGSPGCETTECYIPNQASLSVGEKVIFSNTDSAAHTFTSGNPADGPSGVFDSSLVVSGSSYEWTAKNEGSYPYYCVVHPWMEAIIVVGNVSDNISFKTISGIAVSSLNEVQTEIDDLKSENLNLRLENKQLKNQINQQDLLIQSLQEKITDLNMIIQEQIKVIYDWVIAK